MLKKLFLCTALFLFFMPDVSFASGSRDSGGSDPWDHSERPFTPPRVSLDPEGAPNGERVAFIIPNQFPPVRCPNQEELVLLRQANTVTFQLRILNNPSFDDIFQGLSQSFKEEDAFPNITTVGFENATYFIGFTQELFARFARLFPRIQVIEGCPPTFLYSETLRATLPALRELRVEIPTAYFWGQSEAALEEGLRQLATEQPRVNVGLDICVTGPGDQQVTNQRRQIYHSLDFPVTFRFREGPMKHQGFPLDGERDVRTGLTLVERRRLDQIYLHDYEAIMANQIPGQVIDMRGAPDYVLHEIFNRFVVHEPVVASPVAIHPPLRDPAFCGRRKKALGGLALGRK